MPNATYPFTLPIVALSSIDTGLWPQLRNDVDDGQIDDGLEPEIRAELVTAMQAIQDAPRGDGNIIATGDRTFTVSVNADDETIRLEWTSPAGNTFTLAAEQEPGFYDLASRDPGSAALTFACRFAQTVGPQDVPSPSEARRLLHALALRQLFMSQSKVTAVIDPATAIATFEVPGYFTTSTGAVSAPRFFLMQNGLEDCDSDYEVMIYVDNEVGDLGYDPLKGYDYDQIIRLAAEVDAVLATHDLPRINPENADSFAKRMQCDARAGDLMSKVLDLTEPVEYFNIRLAQITNNSELDALPQAVHQAVVDLRGALSITGDVIQTPGADYILERAESLDESHCLFPAAGSGDLLMAFWPFHAESQFADDASLLEFLRSLHGSVVQIPENADKVARRYNLLHVLALATYEMLLARQCETGKTKEAYPYIQADSRLDGTITISFNKGGENFVAGSRLEPIFVYESDAEVDWLTARIDEATGEPVGPIPASAYRSSAEHAFRLAGINPDAVIAKINEILRL